uniref:NADH-ubiquinone oxidoreductase chain 5 n=1 Tax=Lepidodactylus lugubris TaxID=47724 RepID=A0A0A1H7I2_LEPLU|nr:NADH dehydrogenase subunit 5 [Lepidodactylus lugubris]BAP90306.1 NADH dehydrogenase subunit 5 [Lepidodactylus lugubris]
MYASLLHTTLAATIIILLLPLTITTPTHAITITRMMKLATMTSTIPMLTFLNQGLESTTTRLIWTTTNLNIQISFTLDMYSMMFIPIALLITWSILEFTNWYMAADPELNKFAKYLLLFLVAMLILTTANNLFQLFIGWEGVGIMSFMLISWWHARPNANTAALQAIIYNRIGDIGLICSLAWFAMNLNTWEIQLLLLHHHLPVLPLLGLILAAAGKSAQFGLHPWLPSAMEGPTPVSALLHSSTMVVAGIFLLVRTHPLLEANSVALSTCLCLGALTTTFAALCALTQNDIKKIIAFSTSSQLGLMMLTVGLNQPELAFLHISTHAFFKAMLFLCSGSIIHNLNDEQDIRKMGGVQKTMPITASCITLGSLALMGTPFLAGFYTKDTIIETMNMSTLNAWALLTTLAATALTAAYSMRLIFHVQLHTPRHQPTCTPTETLPEQVRPIVRLAMGSILAGLLISTALLPTKPQIMTLAPMTKLAAMIMTLMGLMYALDLAYQTTYTLKPKHTLYYITTTQLSFFNTLVHRTTPKHNMKFSQTLALQSNDLLWYEHITPNKVKTLNTTLATKLATTHTGMIKTYLMTFILLLLTCILYIKLYGTR